MSGLFRRRKDPPPPPPEKPDLESEGGPFYDGSQTTYITGNKERDTGRVRLLIDSLKAVSSKTDPDELLTSMVDRAVEVVSAERGLLFTTDDAGKPVLRVARSSSAKDLEEKNVSFSNQTVQSVLETGDSVCMREDDGGDFDPSQSMINLNIRGIMCVPLVFRAQRQGVIYVDARASERRFVKGDLRFFEAFADMLSMVWTQRRITEERVEAMRMQRDLELARQIQGSLIPAHPLMQPGYALCGHVIPADEAGGDYFDFFHMKEGHIAMAVGDVSGHGAGPALFMAGARAYLRAHAQGTTSPRQIMAHLNAHLAEDMGDDMFMSMFVCVLDPETRQLTYANAGHPTPFLVHPDGRLEDYQLTGMALGVDPDVDWTECGPTPLEPGATVVVFTDGILELRRDDEQYGRERLGESILKNRGGTVEQLRDGIISDALGWVGSTKVDQDDLTVAILRAES